MNLFTLATALVLGLPAAASAAADPGEVVAALLEKDYETAFRQTQVAAEEGDPGAQANLGVMYLKGMGTDKNEASALNWFRMAAGSGVARAQMNLGEMYAKGLGVPQSDVEAAKWYRQAANLGFPEAQFRLGLLYLQGKGVTKDRVQAQVWFRLAADQGNPEAVKLRDKMEELLSADEQKEAARLAHKWQKSPSPTGNGSQQHVVVTPEPARQDASGATPVTAEAAQAIAEPAPPAPETAPAPPSKPAGATAPTAERAATALAPAVWKVQLGAVSSREAAERTWGTLQERHADLFAPLTLGVERADLGRGKGTLYRIQGGPLPDKTSARALCRELAKRRIDCLVVRPRS
jgi:cell division septation protein DedD